MLAVLTSPWRIGGDADECMYASASADSAAIRRRVSKILPVDVMVESAVGDELVDEHRHFHFEAAAKQLDDVPVVDLGEDEHLPRELFGLGLLHHLGLLDGHHRLVLEHALVHDAMPAAAEDLVGGEVVGRLLELLVGEYPEPTCSGAGVAVGAHLLLEDDTPVLLEEPLLCSDELPLLEPQVEPEAHEH
nr:unnamed protein product [Digitaria exilis]